MHFIVTYSGDLRLGNVAPPRHMIQAELSLIVNVSCRNFPFNELALCPISDVIYTETTLWYRLQVL
jgi:hypothetical protein